MQIVSQRIEGYSRLKHQSIPRVSKSSGATPLPLSWTSIASSPLFLKRTSIVTVNECLSAAGGKAGCMMELHTDGGCAGVKTVLNELFDNGA